jgi:aminoglycoside phosphotransferase (APT) family kinase protein
MVELIRWLKEHIPADDNDASVTRVAHGDFRLDNMVIHPQAADRVLAVLDWELSTLGYPLADLAYSAMCYHLPVGFPGMRGLPQPLPEGIPTEQEYVATYCQARGISTPDPTTYAFCMALSLFRAAAIMAGIGARVQLGNASSAQAAKVVLWRLSLRWRGKP